MMKNPVHPEQIVKHDCIEALGLTVTEAAVALGVTRPTLSRVINGRAAISPEMAIRLSPQLASYFRAIGASPLRPGRLDPPASPRPAPTR